MPHLTLARRGRTPMPMPPFPPRYPSTTAIHRSATAPGCFTRPASHLGSRAAMFFSLVAVTVGPRDWLPVAAHVAAHKRAYAWSDNGYGQLRYGDTTTDYTPTPMRLPRGVAARSVAAGHVYSLVVGSNGHIYAWGNNESGQLGNGDETVYSAFTTSVWTRLPHDIAARSVAAGDTHSLAVGGDGHAYAWGNNESGQLGDGSMTGSSTPVEVRLPRGVIAISVAAGRDYSLAMGGDGHVYAWGSNTIGQLGNGSTTSSSTPVQVRLRVAPLPSPSPPGTTTAWR